MTDSNILPNEWLAGDFLENSTDGQNIIIYDTSNKLRHCLAIRLHLLLLFMENDLHKSNGWTTKQPSSASRFLIRGKSNSWSLYLGDGDCYASSATRILSCTILLLDYSCWLWARNSYKIHSVWSKCTRSNVGAWDWELSVSNSGTRNLTQHKVDVRLSVSCK